MLNQSHPTHAIRAVEVPESLSNWRAERFGRVVHVAPSSVRLIQFGREGALVATFETPRAATRALARDALPWQPYRRTRRALRWGKTTVERAI